MLAKNKDMKNNKDFEINEELEKNELKPDHEPSKKAKSQLNPRYEFGTADWVVSVVNTGGKGMSGHAMIVIEGLVPNGTLFPAQFLGQYDINAVPYEDQVGSLILNKRGKITKIRVFEENNIRDYSEYADLALSWNIKPSKAREMIESIKHDEAITKSASEGVGVYLDYQFLGENHPWVKLQNFLGGDLAGHNCAGWCSEKLKEAEVTNNDLIKPPKPSPCLIL